MTFDFSFDLSVLDHANTTGKAPNVEEQASLSLLKRFLQNSDSPQMAQWQHLQQQLADVFLPYMALFDADNWWSYQDFLNASMLEAKQQLLYKDQAPKKRLQLPHSLSIAVWQELLQTMKISEHLVGADVDAVQHLATLCASLPCQVGYAEVCSIAALNCFEVRTELQVSDLVHMAAMLSGTDDVKMDLAQLVTLDIRLPSWSWPDVVLQCELADTEDSKLSLKQLEKQLTAQHLKPANDPATDLLALFALAQQVGQQKIQHTRQLLSSMTHVLLDEDALSNQLQQSAQELQKMLRQQVTALQSNAEQMNKCLELFEADLQKLLPYYVKDNNLLQAKTDDFISQSNKEQKVKIFEWLHSAAEQGDAEAQNQLGDMYEEGQGVMQNDQEAVRWYRKAAEQGAANAQFNLGSMYKEGRGVTQNNREAVSWYRKAADQGHAEAATCLDNINKVWYDSSTNLTWMRCSLGQTWDGTTCVGTAEKYTRDAAKKAVLKINRNGGYAGYTDWVVPDLNALKSLLRHHDNPPKIDRTIFPNTPAESYWSASRDKSLSIGLFKHFACFVDFERGGEGSMHQRNKCTIRAVRAGR